MPPEEVFHTFFSCRYYSFSYYFVCLTLRVSGQITKLAIRLNSARFGMLILDELLQIADD